ncbi:hypothetical protein ASC76_10390 [Rhizobacter sp. Root404]|nr:hypothetical protein ASC76_10390 [Rhizobacter sp. Root404]
MRLLCNSLSKAFGACPHHSKTYAEHLLPYVGISNQHGGNFFKTLQRNCWHAPVSNHCDETLDFEAAHTHFGN